ncbi:MULTISPECIES: glycosyltransferase [Streptomyces violaceusniger group]|uniref:Glycosyltransferase n=2 Tax=Streptomyces violaceusniger group TaxID=2839105 RepID=A0ABD5JMB7_9ACTN|nr:glycosyltransferase [Streptomyces violaceusniger]MEE4588239.1 glycosyltransferase [Streptomyces sp. DSM 41602]
MAMLWGVSFDATPISGVVVEFVKIARHFHDRGYEVHLDLGYDIKADKNRFFRPYHDEARLLPPWVRLSRIPALDSIDGYDASLVTAVLQEVVEKGDLRLMPEVERITDAICERLLTLWEEIGVTRVLVENGTLPENIMVTRALQRAITVYGARHGLGRFVLWRDHDLMWQSEPGNGKYGSPPYPHVPPLLDSGHLRYLALHERARELTQAWAPHVRHIDVLPNAFPCRVAEVTPANASFRAAHGIPAGARLIARTTRIIPQKRIDRDIRLVAALAPTMDVRLFVAGDTGENPGEYRRLTALAAGLGVSERIVFGGWLTPDTEATGVAPGGGWSVRDLLAHADLVSFLTSYDYESYGNPVGEAIAAGVPYLTSDYELYSTVYGDKGFRAPVLRDDLPTPTFVSEVAHLLNDDTLRAATAEHNHRLGEQHFGRTTAAELLDRLVLTPMGARTRLSVVLPVYNEAANLPAVLDSLYGQRDLDGGRLDPELYEIVLVDNNSTDDTVALAKRYAAEHPDLAVHVVHEPEQGVSCARRTGMLFAAERSTGRPATAPAAGERFYLVSADADCKVDPRWLSTLLSAMDGSGAAIGVCDYYYREEHFAGRPRLWDAIERTLRCRAVAFSLFGGFPDGKGFAVEREAHDRAGGIEIFYQLERGRFVNHLSDDWDFGIKVSALGGSRVYVPGSRVEINPRRVDHALDEVIEGKAYGSHGTIVMRDIRPEADDCGGEAAPVRDLTEEEALRAWQFSIKDFLPKNLLLPLLLDPELLATAPVREFFGDELADALRRRIAEIVDEMRIVDFTPIHAYKTPSFRLYFEFADELFARLRAAAGDDIGFPPPLPDCLADIPRERFREFVHYYCEDRESGEAHDYFGNGGVF